jgi:hypothetical protein
MVDVNEVDSDGFDLHSRFTLSRLRYGEIFMG